MKADNQKSHQVRRTLSKRGRKALRRRQLRTGERLHAWHSPKMDRWAGFALYRRADGGVVRVTYVSQSRVHGLGYPDVKYLGKVVGYLFDGLVTSHRERLF